MTLLADLDRLLHERFGFPGFRPGQREAIETLLTDGALLCIQPTGYGKSLLYQLPAAALDGVTVVISPLLALMRDQLGQLNERFGIPAASLNSDQTPEENDAVEAAARAGRLRILFVSPEQLERLDRVELLAALPLALVVIDEAHCISTWGHDFRPAYRQIALLLRTLSERRPPGADPARVLALTATADARTEADIRAQLEAARDRPIAVQRRSMDRPNLALAVQRVASFEDKLAWLARELPRMPGPGLLYCATRDNTEVVAEYLRGALGDGRVAAYHAGLAPDAKRALQARFLAGDFTAIAATNALGMGIDKGDLRYVVHVDVPGSITAYYQEVGRAGRDGQPARGVLLFDPADLRIQEYFIQSAQPTVADFDAVLRVVGERVSAGEPPRLNTIRAASGLHPTRVTVVLAELIEQGFLEKRLVGRAQTYAPTGRAGAPDLGRYERQEAVRRRELAAMRAYAEERGTCAMQTLRRALGDDHAERCGR
ncbi:MAG: ATP-dependent DNA helicase RecQ, partial [Deltaproteobacteria bacterium]